MTRHQELEQRVQSGDSAARADLEALATYIAGRFAAHLTNATGASQGSPPKPPDDSARAQALRILTQQPTVSPEQFAAASARVEQSFRPPPQPPGREPRKFVMLLMGLSVAAYLLAVKFVILPCLIGSLLFRGGALVKLLGIVFVTRSGTLASRWRVTARNLVAWLPFLLLLPGGQFRPRGGRRVGHRVGA